ncbi:hypothetical protein B0919_06430 [Hymenobacter sp. CRA2]|nr:hypothetical protein B0919_06430 [Hymenobacter sp. CRA2]
MDSKLAKRDTNACGECGSLYFADASKIMALCPECAHWLYGYSNCNHTMEQDRCLRCYWDGSVTSYVQSLK